MVANGFGKKTRVLLAYTEEELGSPLASVAEAAPELDIREIVGSPDDIWRIAVVESPELTVLHFSDMRHDRESCLRRIMSGCRTRILLITDDSIPADIAAQRDRVSICLPPAAQADCGEIAALMLLLCGIRREAAPPAAKPSAVTEIAAQGALVSKIIAFGASTGGTEALSALFKRLKPELPGIVVSQHMPPGFTEMFAERLDRELPFEVTVARDNTRIEPGSIHIAPGERHLMIKKSGADYYTVLGDSQKVSGHCPSVDVLFESVARFAGTAAIGVILTGMGGDGAKGLLQMRNSGAYTIGQDEQSCVVYGMPKKAYDIGAVVKQAGLEDIPALITRLAAAER